MEEKKKFTMMQFWEANYHLVEQKEEVNFRGRCKEEGRERREGTLSTSCASFALKNLTSGNMIRFR